MTEEKNISASAEKNKEKDKFADKVLTEDKLDNVAGGTGGKWRDFGVKPKEDTTFHGWEATTGK